MQVLNRLTIMLSLQALVLAMSASLALAGDVELLSANFTSDPLPESKILAQHVTTTLLPQLVGSDDQLSQRLGFSSLAQIANLLLWDPPFKVYRVGLTKLTEFDPAVGEGQWAPILGQENWFLFPLDSRFPSDRRVKPVRFLFPIRESSRPPLGCTPPSLADTPALGCIASSVQVKWLSITGKWEFQQIGRPGLIKKLTQYGKGDTHFVIWIPVLNLHYLARFGSLGLMIKAIAEDRYVTDPSTGNPFKAGQELLGNEVFAQLKHAVRVQHIEANGPPG